MYFFTGTANPDLAKAVAKALKIKLGKVKQELFSDGELYVNIEEDVKDQTVFVFQSGKRKNKPIIHRYLMELLIMIDALKLLKPKKIIAVLPFFPYRRQIEKTESGESITATLVARLLKAAGVDRAIVLDLHEESIIKDFDFPVSHISAFDLFVKYFKEKKLPNLTVVAPDEGSLVRAKKFSKALDIPLASFEKSRDRLHDVVAKMEMQGKVDGQNIVLLDDEINTAGTLVEAVDRLKDQGAKDIYFACTHPVLSGPAAIRIKQAPIKELIVTDSIAIKDTDKNDKLKVISVADVLAKEIKNLK